MAMKAPIYMIIEKYKVCLRRRFLTTQYSMESPKTKSQHQLKLIRTLVSHKCSPAMLIILHSMTTKLPWLNIYNKIVPPWMENNTSRKMKPLYSMILQWPSLIRTSPTTLKLTSKRIFPLLLTLKMQMSHRLKWLRYRNSQRQPFNYKLWKRYLMSLMILK